MHQTPCLSATPRRHFLRGQALALSAGAVALLGGRHALAARQPADVQADVGILNVAIGLEHEGIGAYTLALKSGLLNPAHVAAATQFRDDHRQHADALIATLRQLGGTPVAPRALDDYAQALKVDQLRTEDDVLDLAARLERGAANAYLGVIPSFRDPALGQIAARLAADEAAHFALLNFDLKRPFAKALSFGA